MAHTYQWLTLIAIIWLQSINGTNTNFPSYSSSLKHLLSLSQLQLNNLALASDAGKLFGFISGLAALHFPLWLVLFIGSTLGLIGYGLQYLFLRSLSYWQLLFLNVLGGNSICWINTVCYIVSVKNFPDYIQVAVGLSTSYVGLSAMVYTALVNAVFPTTSDQGDPEAYLLLNATVPLGMSIITAPFTRLIDSDSTSSRNESRIGFFVVTLITVSTGIYAIIITSSSSSRLEYSSSGKLVVILMMCLALPIVVPLGEFLRGTIGVCLKRKLYCTSSSCEIQTKRRVCDEILGSSSTEERSCSHNISSNTASLTDDHKTHRTTHSTTNNNNDQVGEDMPVMEETGPILMLKKFNFWLYFFIYFLGATIGLVYLNNLGQIAESRGWHHPSSLVSLSSAFGFLGRLLPCLLHCIWSRRGRLVPGPACIFFLMIPLSGSFFLLLHTSNINLFLSISTATVGFCTGAITTICVSITTQLFGKQNFGVNHNLVVANIPMGSFLFGDMAAFLYRKATDTSSSSNSAVGGLCVGLSCYRNTFLICGSLCSIGTFLSVILHFRTRHFYLSRYGYKV